MCDTVRMPATHPKSNPRVSTRLITVSFADDAAEWLREINEAVQANPKEIRVQFIGASIAPPFEIIALRNALLQIPEEIRLVTIATCSLPPFGCAAWLVGDERQIARDAVVWIPKLPECLLREGQKGSESRLLKEGEEDSDDESEDDEDPEAEPNDQRLRSMVISSNKKSRVDFDLRALADVLNEWFPSWEFSGSYLDFNDLLAWEVVRPEWGFGGRGTRTRQPQTELSPSRRVEKKSGTKKEPLEEPSPGSKASEKVPTSNSDGSKGESPIPGKEA